MSREWLHTMDGQGLTPLDRAFRSGHMAIAELLLRQEQEDRAETPGNSSPLHRAASLGLTGAVKSLLKYGADPTAVDGQGETALHKAVRQGRHETIEMLVGESDVNTHDNEGMTPLHYACMAGDKEIVRLLLVHGADPWIRNEVIDGLTPVDLASSMGYDEVAQFLTMGEVFV